MVSPSVPAYLPPSCPTQAAYGLRHDSASQDPPLGYLMLLRHMNLSMNLSQEKYMSGNGEDLQTTNP